VKTPRPTYSLMDEMLASPTEPVAAAARTHMLTCMWEGLHAFERAGASTPHDWRVCSDAVNLMESLVDMDVVEDTSGLLQDAIAALAQAGARAQRGEGLTLDEAGQRAVRAVLDDFASVIEQVPARTMVRCHRRTERRIRDILTGRGRSADVQVMSL
jgi:hypothetical protein